MTQLVIHKRLGKLMNRMPHRLFINGTPVAVMTASSLAVSLPAGRYSVTVQSSLPWFYSTAAVEVTDLLPAVLEIGTREKWWEILFAADLVFWVVKRFITLAAPWTWIYEVVTNGYFVIWLIYEWRIRKHYFTMNIV